MGLIWKLESLVAVFQRVAVKMALHQMKISM